MLYCHAKRIFIGGGGDGLAATRLLKYPEVNEIVVCDYDQAVTELAKNQPDLRSLNLGSLLDPRVRIIHQDAYEYMENSSEYFDLIILDTPDPCTSSLARFHSDTFYRLVRDRLCSGGVFSQQAPSYPESAALVQSTVKQIFPNSEYLRACYSGSSNGFVVAANGALKRFRSLPSWTKYLNEPVLNALSAIPNDELIECDQVNSLSNNKLLKAYIVEACLNRASEPYKFNPNYQLITVNRDNVCPCEQSYILFDIAAKYTHLLYILSLQCWQILVKLCQK